MMRRTLANDIRVFQILANLHIFSDKNERVKACEDILIRFGENEEYKKAIEDKLKELQKP